MGSRRMLGTGQAAQPAPPGSVLITKRGKPLARVIPVEAPRPLGRSVTYYVDDESLIQPIEDRWEAAEA